MKNKIGLILVFSVFLLVGAVKSFAAEDMPMDPAAMTPEQQEMQARMQEYMTPNVNHEFLSSWVGSWEADVKFWMDPNAPAVESKGTSENKMIMDGRFLEETFSGTMMGKPFEGRGIYGYDNMRQEFTGLWFDNMATGIMVSAGQYDQASKTFTEEGSMSCPMTQESHRWYKAVTTWIDEDHYTYESYMKDKDGNEYKGMIINYSRVK